MQFYVMLKKTIRMQVKLPRIKTSKWYIMHNISFICILNIAHI